MIVDGAISGAIMPVMMSFLEIGVSDLGRAEEFYSGLLGFTPGEATTDAEGHAVKWLAGGKLKLVEVGAEGQPSGWDRDDRQCGIRHFGMKVADVDTWAARLAAAGVEFARKPFDAFGGVRICFFFDPDGAYLEFVQGYVQHTNLWSAALARAELDDDAGWDGAPRFDHVAITAPDLDEALAYYRDELGFGGVGQLVRPDDERGFLITNLRAAAPATLEMFTFGAPTLRRDGVGEPDRLGLRAIGVHPPVEPTVGPGDVPVRSGPAS